MRAGFCVALVLGFAGCETLGITTPRVDGEWLLTAQSLSDGVRICAIDGLTLALEQRGTTVSGTASGGTVTCVQDDETVVIELPTRPIVNGTVDDADDIEFDIGGPDWHHEGEVVGGSMTGVVRIRFGGTLGAALFTGTFGAAMVETEDEQ